MKILKCRIMYIYNEVIHVADENETNPKVVGKTNINIIC